MGGKEGQEEGGAGSTGGAAAKQGQWEPRPSIGLPFSGLSPCVIAIRFSVHPSIHLLEGRVEPQHGIHGIRGMAWPGHSARGRPTWDIAGRERETGEQRTAPHNTHGKDTHTHNTPTSPTAAHNTRRTRPAAAAEN